MVAHQTRAPARRLPVRQGVGAVTGLALDETHAASLASWVESANDPATDFPIQNLPFGRFRRSEATDWRIGVAIGDQILDLRSAGLIDIDDMNHLIAAGTAARRKLRQAVSDRLAARSPEATTLRQAIVSQ